MRRLIALAGMVLAAGGGTATALQALQADSGRALIAAFPARPRRGEPPSPLDRSITLVLDRVPLKRALDEVARQAGVHIAYSHRVVPVQRPVTLRLTAVSVRVALDTLLHATAAAAVLDPSGQILLVKRSDRMAGAPEDPPGAIAGTVRDAGTGSTLVSVTVLLVGTRFSVLTGTGGRYAIAEVPPGTYRVRARLLGYAPGDTAVVVADGQQTVVDFRLQRSAIELNPLVAVGYATVQKSDLTGSVATVTADQFKTPAAPTVTLTSGLQGKAPGVQVVSNSGLPGAGIRVRVRGTGSITA